MELVVAHTSKTEVSKTQTDEKVVIINGNQLVASSGSEISEKNMTSRRSGRLARRSNQAIIEDEDPIEEMMLDDSEEEEEEDDDEYMSERNKIQVGPQYQAVLPDLIEDKKTLSNYRTNTGKLEKLMWSPYLYAEKKTKDKLQEYLDLAANKHYFNEVQALYVLNLCGYDVLAATRKIQHLAPLPDSWTDDEHDHFLEILSFLGKDFNQIAKKLPNRSTQQVVERFYKWKATAMKQLQNKKKSKGRKRNSKRSRRICEIEDESKGYPMPAEKSQYCDLKRELENQKLEKAFVSESLRCVDDNSVFDSCKAALAKEFDVTRKQVQALKQKCEEISKSIGTLDIPRPPKELFH